MKADQEKEGERVMGKRESKGSGIERKGKGMRWGERAGRGGRETDLHMMKENGLK